MKRIFCLFLLLIVSDLYALEAWEKPIPVPLRTLYVTSGGNGGKLRESIGDTYNGREVDAKIWKSTQTSGKLNGGMAIDGNTCSGATCNEPYIKIVEPAIFGDNTFAIAGWVKPDVNTAGMFFAATGSGPNTDARVSLELNGAGNIVGIFKDDAATTITLTSTGVVEDDGNWHFVVLSSVGATDHKMYVCTTSSCDAAISNTSTTITTYTEIIQTHFNPNLSSQVTGNFDGAVDEFQFYSVSMSAGDVTTQFNSGSGTATALANAVAQYHMDEAEFGTTTDRIDLDEIDGFMLPGDLVSLEAISPSPDGYISDRIDFGATEEHHWGPWFTITQSGTSTNPIVIKCESNWPSDCRFSSRMDITGNYTWLWGIWSTGKNGANVSACDPPGPEGTPVDDGPAGISIAGIGHVVINNWFYHPANFPSYDDDAVNTWNGSVEGGSGAFNSQASASPASIWYGNIFYLAGHSLYAQNQSSAGYMYYVRNINSSPSEATDECQPGQFAADHKMAGFWSSNTQLEDMYVYQNFFTDQQGEHAQEFFHVSDGEPSQGSIIDHNEFWCGGRLVGTPANGDISNGSGEQCSTTGSPPFVPPTSPICGGQGHPQSNTFTNNFAASCRFSFTSLWGTGEDRFTQLGVQTFTGNTILADPAISHDTGFVRTQAYVTPTGADSISYGMGEIQPSTVWNTNTYITDPTFGTRVGNEVHAAGTLTFAEWKAETDQHQSAGAGVGFDFNSTTMDWPTTGERVVMYPNFYDPKMGILMIYNWEEADTVDVDFGTVCANCDRFDLFDTTLRPDDPPVLSNALHLDGQSIAVPMDGEIVRTFRIHILN